MPMPVPVSVTNSRQTVVALLAGEQQWIAQVFFPLARRALCRMLVWLEWLVYLPAPSPARCESI